VDFLVYRLAGDDKPPAHLLPGNAIVYPPWVIAQPTQDP
jgi:hypothetical protein